VKRVRRRKPGRQLVRIGASDASLTATSRVAALAKFVDKLDVVGTFARGIRVDQEAQPWCQPR